MPVYTGQMTLFSVGGQDLLGVFKDVTLTLQTETQDARYAMQGWKDPTARISEWSIDTNTVVDAAEGITLISMLAGAAVPILFESSSVGGISLSGNGLVTTYTRTGPDSDGQANAIHVAGKGEPTITAST